MFLDPFFRSSDLPLAQGQSKFVVGNQPQTDTEAVGMKAIMGSAAEAPEQGPEARLADLKSIYSNDLMITEFNKFLSNVFMQLDEKKLEVLLKDILGKNMSYEETYKELLARIGEAQKGFIGGLKSQLRSLKVIKQVLGDQIGQLLGKGGKVKGYCEIGYSGRLIRPIQKHAEVEITGRKYVVNDVERLTRYIETGFPLPYDEFVSLRDYAPLTDRIKPGSIELAVCPIGLHHATKEQLEVFAKSISAIIAPGGSFILRDHDANDPVVAALADAAHSVFNAATGETVASEMGEVRRFNSLNHWVELMEKHGFQLVGGPEIQEGDSTENSLVRFVKLAQNAEEALPAMETYLKTSQKGYERAQSQTYLTTLEWHLVATAREYADFVKDKPAHEFPFFKHIKVLWGTFFDSVRDGFKNGSFGAVLSSEHLMMSLFMVFTTTFDLLYKGMTALPLALLRRGSSDNDLSTAKTMAQINDEYAEYIKATPFYEFDFFGKIGELWRSYRQREPGHLLANTYFLAVNTLGLGIWGLTAMPLKWMYSGLEPGNITLVVKDEQGQITDDAEKGVRVLASDNEHDLRAIEAPRYLKLVEMLRDFAHRNIDVASIAGCKKVQVKVKATDAAAEQIAKLPGVARLSDIAIPTDAEHHYVRLDVETASLSKAIRGIEAAGAEITYIHDL